MPIFYVCVCVCVRVCVCVCPSQPSICPTDTFKRARKQGVQPNAHMYCATICACARRMEIATLPKRTRLVLLNRAFNLYTEMGESRLHADAPVHNALLAACGAAKQFGRALSVFRNMQRQGCKASERTYFELICIANSCGNGDEALKFYDMFKESGVAGSKQLYTTAIQACKHLRGGPNAGTAWNIWRDMEAARVAPDSLLFANLVSIAVNAWGAEGAEDVIVQSRDYLAELPAEETDKAVRAGYNTLLGWYAHKGRAEEMLAQLERMKSSGVVPDEDTYETLIVGCSKANDHRSIVSLFKQQREAGLPLTPLMYTWAVSAAVRAGDAAAAFDHAEMAWSEGVPRSQVITFWLLRGCVARVSLIYQVGASSAYGSGGSGHVMSGVGPGMGGVGPAAGKRTAMSAESENPIEYWIGKAITAYRDTLDHGIEANIHILDRLLHCMRRPMSHVDKPTTMDRDNYDPRALSIFEDAVQRGIVEAPIFQTEICKLQLEQAMPAVAEVALLCVLRHLRKHPDQRRFDIHIQTQPVSEHDDLSSYSTNAERTSKRNSHHHQSHGRKTSVADTDAQVEADDDEDEDEDEDEEVVAGGRYEKTYQPFCPSNDRAQNKNLHKWKLAAHAVLAMLRRLNIPYDQNRNTGLVVVSKASLNLHFADSSPVGYTNIGYRGNSGNAIRDQQRDIRLTSEGLLPRPKLTGEDFYLMY